MDKKKTHKNREVRDNGRSWHTLNGNKEMEMANIEMEEVTEKL